MSRRNRPLITAGILAVVSSCALLAQPMPRAHGGEITYDASDDPIPLPASQIDAPAYWLRKATNEAIEQLKSKSKPNDSSTDETIDTLLPLLTVGEIRVGDADGARQTLKMLQHRANATSLPATRAMAFMELADFHLQMCDQHAFEAALAEARKAIDANQNEYVKPMLDVRLAALFDQAGQQLDADDVARQTNDLKQKAAIYCTLAISASQHGNVYDVTRRLDRGRAAAEGEDDDTSSAILCRVAKTYAQLNKFDAARITADNIADPAARADAYGTLALRQMKINDARGYRDAILKAYAAIATLPHKDAAWRYDLLAYQQQEANDAEGVRRTLELSRYSADHVTDMAAQAKALFDLAEVYAASGNVAACLATVADSEKAAAKSAPADAGLGVMSAERARALANAPPIEVIPGIRYCDLSCALSRAGRLDAAERMIDRIPAGVDRAQAIAALAEAKANMDDVDGAKDLLGQLSNHPALLARICRRIGESYTRRGQFEDLSRWVASLKSAGDRSYACLGAADGMLDRRVTEFSAADMSLVFDP